MESKTGNELNGTLLTDSQDLAWAIEVYELANIGETCPVAADEIGSVIVQGNEDAPSLVWVSADFPPMAYSVFHAVAGHELTNHA